ncbi:MAG: hypothetical protein CMM74_01710 [Rhodospirillaceae bacterium]|jgi:hypothetical protein|nr:hypothetical protein [Rhodospirillaceae bacterium]
MNIIEKTDDEILAIANPLWSHLIKASNDGKYGEFVKYFSLNLLRGLNEVEVGKQFAKSELTRNLSESVEFIGTIRRGEHVTVLYRTRSKKKKGEWLGRLVIGYEDKEIKIFGASIF